MNMNMLQRITRVGRNFTDDDTEFIVGNTDYWADWVTKRREQRAALARKQIRRRYARIGLSVVGLLMAGLLINQMVVMLIVSR